MKIIESHHTKDVPMSVFYIMFIKYGAKLFDDIVLSEEEKTINNRLLAYELNFIAGINNR
ncbi:hypothetical protein [Vibrio algicola]|uniref:Uncharacterized protein n=1 Tax=Vibrio algicola TaxID=2662262 RepID=A0A5Q0TBJ6_9VIBR|nr:hypothetical protein [Vibrio algicola]